MRGICREARVESISDPPFARIAIAGLGLVGGSLAQAVRRAWPAVKISGVDRAAVIAPALASGAIDDAPADIGLLGDVDLLVLATPVPAIVTLIADAERSGVRAVVTDAGSTKRHIMNAAARTRLTFVGGHPVAGSARRGFEHARPDLFDGHPWLLVPPRGGESAADAAGAVEGLERFVKGLGAAPRRVDAETHDRVMAYVSHLPQLLSSVLMRTAGQAVGDAGLGASGRGFADMTRLASSPAELWQGILASNADFVLEAVQAFVAALPATVADLGDASRLDAIFREANQFARRLE